MIPLISVVFFALLFLASPQAAVNAPQLPSFAGTILEKQFPESKTAELEDLRRYRQDLETFREFVLEGYNKGLIEYARKLDASARDLEEKRRRGKINADAYDQVHTYLRLELEKITKDGEYFRIYKQNLARYRRRALWVIHEITRKERQQLRF